MAARTNKRWVGRALLTFTGVSPILVTIYNTIYCSSLCGFNPLNYASVMGISLVFLGVILLALGRQIRQHSHRYSLIQDCIFATIFILIGAVLFFQRWRLDPSLKLTTLLWTFSTIY
jgi:hypothetical protein